MAHLVTWLASGCLAGERGAKVPPSPSIKTTRYTRSVLGRTYLLPPQQREQKKTPSEEEGGRTPSVDEHTSNPLLPATKRVVLSYVLTNSPSATTQGAPTSAEQVRPSDLTPPPQHACCPLKSGPPSLPGQPAPAAAHEYIPQHCNRGRFESRWIHEGGRLQVTEKGDRDLLSLVWIQKGGPFAGDTDGQTFFQAQRARYHSLTVKGPAAKNKKGRDLDDVHT